MIADRHLKETTKLNFLLKIEEALDKLILSLVGKFKALTPSFVFALYHWFLDLPSLIKKQFKTLQPKLRVKWLKFIGYTEHYTNMVRGHFVGTLIYLRSDEFKKKNKWEMVFGPLRKFKTDPIKAFSVTLALTFFVGCGVLIFQNTAKIVAGTKSLRAPASARETEEPLLELRKIKYTTKLPAGQEVEVLINVEILAKSHEDLDLMIKGEEQILEHITAFPIKVDELPLRPENKKEIEEKMLASLAHELHVKGLKSLHIKQVLDGRPKYFMQTEKLLSFTDTNLQLFLEDTRRNRQVWIDFTALASNRFVIMYLKEHLVQVKDHLNVNVEPVIPRLPIEDEGRQIIKDKIKLELNEFLKKEGVEGKVLEIYIDYLIVS